MNTLRLVDNTQYVHQVTGAYFWYYNNIFVTINEGTRSVDCFSEDDMGENINYLELVTEELTLDKEEDAETIQLQSEDCQEN